MQNLKKLKLLVAVPFLIILASGCASRPAAQAGKAEAETSSVKEAKVDAQKENLGKIVAQAERDGEKQAGTIKQAAKSYIGGISDLAVANPAKVNELASGINKAILISGVVTQWQPSTRSDSDAHDIYTVITVHVTQQHTFRQVTDLTGQDIHVVQPGGLTTVGAQWRYYPKKDFENLQEPTAEEKQQPVFVEDSEMPLPRIGDQLITAIQPFAHDASLQFLKHNRFDQKEDFVTAHGDNGQFFLNQQTGQYESRAVKGVNYGFGQASGVGQAPVYESSATNVLSGDDSGQIHDNAVALLKDINQRFAVKTVSD
ncbi:hypothetical protein [Schleiferilactobacillus perolens]|uniref:Lipoprotein n=1 Tax=Schleiferilactobacillus perolens DSM 12744 TaxID=1423792 RepID=A0A0R1MSC7_9LACO|nr:hypothetical protein [Schleiferilactobacillus perolens]KRL11040.1 hypothetical protein FD09_GL000762 [Schleiferilactobacillus perolens DSM 12744]